MRLAKAALDVGLFTDHVTPMLAFWQQQAGLACTEALALGDDLTQHRHAIGASVLKLNEVVGTLAREAPGPINGVSIVADVAEPLHFSDPDGNRLSLIPRGHNGVEQLCVHLACNDPESTERFYRDAIGLEVVSPGVLTCGTSRLHLSQGHVDTGLPLRAPGYRYLTFQVFNADRAYEQALTAGGTAGVAPYTIGDIARIAFVRDPDGTWIELSQRRSIVGTLDTG